MSKPKNKQTQAEKEYQRERKRIQQFINRAQKQGLIFDESILPPKPKKVTKESVNRLRKITPDVLRSKAMRVEPQTGKIVKQSLVKPKAQKTEPKVKTGNKPKVKTGNKPKVKTGNKPKQEKPYYPRYSGIVLSNVRDAISRFTPPLYWTPAFYEEKLQHKFILETILERAISKYGEDVVALRLDLENSDEIISLVNGILYDSEFDRVEYRIHRMAEILNGGPLDAEEAQFISEISEANESHEEPR